MIVNPFSYLIEKLKSKFDKSGGTISGHTTIDRKDGTTTSVGQSFIIAGNDIPEGTAGNSKGILRLWGKGAKYTNLSATNATENRAIELPDMSGTLALTSDLGVTYSKSVSNLSINSAVGNLFEGVVAVSTGTSGVGKRVVATFVPTSSFAFAVIRSVTASEVNISLEKGNSGTVSGTIYVTIYP